MEKYRFAVALLVEIEAFDALDAEDTLRDAFGLGDTGYGVAIVESEIGDYHVV